jgi:Domain of unknown function (DUF4349)
MVGALAAAALVVIITGCAGGAASPGGPGQVREDIGGQPAAAAPSGAADGSSTASGNKGALAALADQKIIKTGEITVEVPNVASALAAVRSMAVELGGYVGGAQAGTLDDAATLTLRIPADKFDDAIARVQGIKSSKVLSQSQREEDVTSTVVDLDARLKNLQASEAQYRALLAKAQKIEDILSVQSRLDDVRGQIEQLSAQLKTLNNQADLSTLTVTLQPTAKPIQEASADFDPGAAVNAAVGALLQVGQALVIGAIWLGIVGIPLAIAVAILVLVLMRLGLLARRRAPVAPEPPAAA